MLAAVGGWMGLDIGATENFVNHLVVMRKSWVLYFFLLNFRCNVQTPDYIANGNKSINKFFVPRMIIVYV